MALSQADFYAYSRATGAPVPENPEDRAQMAPEVLAFRRNQLKAPQQQREQGPDPLSVGLGVGLALAGGVGAALGARRLFGGRKQAANAGVRQVNLAEMAAPESPVRRVATESVPEPSKVAQNIEEEEYVAYRPDPKEMVSKQVAEARRQAATESLLQASQVRRTPYQLELGGELSPTLQAIRSSEFGPNLTQVREQALGLVPGEAPSRPLSIAPNQLNVFKQPSTEEDVVSQIINKYQKDYETEKRLETGRATQQEMRRQASVVKNIEQEVDQALAEIRKEPVQKFNPRSYIEARGSVAPAEDLTSAQQQSLPQVIDQKINAVESGEDQMTGRIKQQLQRNEDLDLGQIEILEDIASQQRGFMMEQDEPINRVAQATPDGLLVDQAEGVSGPITAQEMMEQAKQEMINRRQALIESGLRPGTVRFERALAQPFRTSPYAKIQGTGPVETSLPTGPIRQTLQGVSASQPLTETTVLNIGPEAVVTQTAAGTAIRGTSPVYQTAEPVERTRQIFGTADVLVPGAPNEMMPDRPGRETAMQQIIAQPQPPERIDPYAVKRLKGGSAGIGVYGPEVSYVPGAVSKATGEYSAAASRLPSYVPEWQLKQQQTPFSNVSSEALNRALEKSGKSGTRAIGAELERRQTTKESMEVSEALRRARIEGRDPNMILKQFGIGS